MSLVSKAVWIVERNLAEPITLGEIADACAVSRFHLAHAFGASTGTSLMQYLRGRRLTTAATALANGETDILGLALETGYSSHQAFSRAFKARFGTTPRAVRRRMNVCGLPTIQAIKFPEEIVTEIQEPRFESGKAMLLVGLSERQSLGNTQHIASKWQQFMAAYEDIPNKKPTAPIGVSTNMDEDGNFDYVCAVEVTNVSKLPGEFIQLRVPSQRYAVFLHQEHVASISQTYSMIWNHWFPTHEPEPLEGPCLERHLPTFDPQTGLGGIEIWVPVKA